MRICRTLALGAVSLVLMLSACAPGGSGSSSPSANGSQTANKPAVSVGSADFYEAAVVAEMYAQALEAKGYTVDRHLQIGERPAVHAAMSGDINLIPDYLGGLAGQGLGLTELPSDPQTALDNMQEALADKGWVSFNYSPGTDADGFAVTAETASEFGLSSMSDLTEVAGQLRWGVASGCLDNPVCGPGLKDTYGIDLEQVLELETDIQPCSSRMVTALLNDTIDVAQVCTTQPAIIESNLVLLSDDKSLQPAQNIVPIATSELADAAPADFAETLNAISAALTTEALTQLGVEIEVNQTSLEDAARTFLEDNGLL